MSIRIILFLTFYFAIVYNAQAQVDSLIAASEDTIPQSIQITDLWDYDTTSIQGDSLSVVENNVSDSLHTDSLNVSSKPKEGALKDKVIYSAEDSMKISLANETMYLYGNAHVKYMDVELNADYIELNYAKEEVFAKGSIDTSGQVIGKPEFSQGNENFKSDSIKYNFGSNNGIIYHIITQQGEGFLHSDKSKRHSNEHIHAYGNKYTTCDAEHPHFYLALKKAIIIPDDKIIAGPSYFVIEDVPLKIIGLPFGFFPNTTKRTSGLLFPTFGEERARGFFLRDLGWYQVLGDYADLRVLGDFYSKGSWGVQSQLSYKWRYHFAGNFSFNYNENKNNEDATFAENKQYRIRWSHRQDGKSNPSQSFSAHVDFSSSQYDKYNSYNMNDYLRTHKTSGISFTKNWTGTPAFNLAISANADQNSQTRSVDISLPTGSFNMNQVYPFRSKSGSGKYKWYENIFFQYNSSFDNQIYTYDSILFSQETLDTMKYGFQHTIPLSVNFKIGKAITIAPSMNYKGVFYSAHTVMDSVVYNEETKRVDKYSRRVNEGAYAQAINPSISMKVAPRLYGMLVSTKEDSYVEAIRHVMSPSVGFSYTPDMKNINKNYYDSLTYIDSMGVEKYLGEFNPFMDEVYSQPPSSNGRSGSLSLSLNNNLEMKVRPRNDTSTESKKIVILENLNFSTRYSPWKESFKWNDVSMVTGTKFFKKKLGVQMNASFSPYAYAGNDSITRKKIEIYYYETAGGLNFLRPTRVSLKSSFSLKSKSGNKDDNADDDKNDTDNNFENDFAEGDIDFTPTGYSGSYVDFEIPWSFNASHTWAWSRPQHKVSITHSASLSGDFSLTPKWKIGVRTGYDFEAKTITFTNISIHRDLHCWQMSFNVVPFGPRASYSFTIRAKSSLLSDLKYEKKPNFYDNF